MGKAARGNDDAADRRADMPVQLGSLTVQADGGPEPDVLFHPGSEKL